MATQVLVDAFVSAAGTDLSDHVKSVTLTYSSDLVDMAAMGSTTHTSAGGLKDWSATIEFFADEASSKVQQTFFTLVGSTVALIIRPDKSDGVGATNPNYTGTGLVESLDLVKGSLGDAHMSSVSIKAAGALSRATS